AIDAADDGKDARCRPRPTGDAGRPGSIGGTIGRRSIGGSGTNNGTAARFERGRRIRLYERLADGRNIGGGDRTRSRYRNSRLGGSERKTLWKIQRSDDPHAKQTRGGRSLLNGRKRTGRRRTRGERARKGSRSGRAFDHARRRRNDPFRKL